MGKIALTSLLLLALAHDWAFAANCVLPEPDGGGEKPSRENLHGAIAHIRTGEIKVLSKDGRLTSVATPKSETIFTAFGGDGKPSDLMVGQTVWIWYTNCKVPKTGLPEPAYFQVYSMNPKDKP